MDIVTEAAEAIVAERDRYIDRGMVPLEATIVAAAAALVAQIRSAGRR